MTTTYVYDGSTLVAEYPGTGSVYHAPGIGWTDGGGVRYYYRENGIGSNLAVLNASAVVQSRSEYDAYGVEKVILSGAKSNHRFAGRHGYYKDDNSGLTLLGARYYSALLGRFLTQDPIDQEDDLNLYAYVKNSPLGNIDPDGTQSKGVGQPGFLESFIPVYGSGRAAVDDFQNGRWGMGLLNTAFAVSDVFMVGTVVKSVAKIGVKATAAIARQSWSATRKMIGKDGLALPKQPLHHIVKQKAFSNSTLAKAILNQPFMVTKLKMGGYSYKGINFTTNQWHKLLDGYRAAGYKMNLAERAYFGSNAFQKAAAMSAGGTAVRVGRNIGEQ